MKFLTVLSIYIGEALIIGSEVITAKFAATNSASTPFVIFTMFMAAFGSCLTVWGYFLGIKLFNNIWVITVVCITAIIILEPFIIYFLTHQIPGRGALVGFIFGVLGLVATLIL